MYKQNQTKKYYDEVNFKKGESGDNDRMIKEQISFLANIIADQLLIEINEKERIKNNGTSGADPG
jgi:hypothetical protein